MVPATNLTSKASLTPNHPSTMVVPIQTTLLSTQPTHTNSASHSHVVTITNLPSSSSLVAVPTLSNVTATQAPSQENLHSVGGMAGLVGIIAAAGSIVIFIVLLVLYKCCHNYHRKANMMSQPFWKRSQVSPWNLSSAGSNDHNEEGNGRPSHYSRRTSDGSREFPEIVVMDARPASDQSTVSFTQLRQPYQLTMPYIPPTPEVDEPNYMAMTDSDPEFDAFTDQHSAYTPPPSQIPKRTFSNMTYPITQNPKRTLSSSTVPSRIPLPNRSSRTNSPVTNPSPRRDNFENFVHGSPPTSIISWGSTTISPPGSPPQSWTPPLRRSSLAHGVTMAVAAQKKGLRKGYEPALHVEHDGVRGKIHLEGLEEADVGDEEIFEQLEWEIKIEADGNGRQEGREVRRM